MKAHTTLLFAALCLVLARPAPGKPYTTVLHHVVHERSLGSSGFGALVIAVRPALPEGNGYLPMTFGGTSEKLTVTSRNFLSGGSATHDDSISVIGRDDLLDELKKRLPLKTTVEIQTPVKISVVARAIVGDDPMPRVPSLRVITLELDREVPNDTGSLTYENGSGPKRIWITPYVDDKGNIPKKTKRIKVRIPEGDVPGLAGLLPVKAEVDTRE